MGQKDDLNAFHMRVFGSAGTFTQYIPIELSSQGEPANCSKLEEEEEELGYYPDGNKRTLTDDQIAMFRHSEIYAILRERQVREENNEAVGGYVPDGSAFVAATMPRNPLPDETMIKDNHGEAHVAVREDSFEDSEGTSKNSAANNKRKRHSTETCDRSSKASTRRLVRELDFVTAENQVLDYGDEPSDKVPYLHTHPGEASAEGSTNQHDSIDSVPGKKIWWPMIQAT